MELNSKKTIIILGIILLLSVLVMACTGRPLREPIKINKSVIGNQSLIIGKPDKLLCSKLGGVVCESYEVCEGTILSASDTNRCCEGACNLPKEFDWRNRHSKNWVTSVKNQGSFATCGFFAQAGSIEANINLYYNQELNLDLSEQFSISCQHSGSLLPEDDFNIINECISSTDYGYLGSNGCLLYKFGITDESCSPYIGFHSGCDSDMICSDWKDRLWKPTNVKGYSRFDSAVYSLEKIGSIDDIKKLIIKKGTIPFSYGGHAVLLIGYDDDNGKTLFILKDQYGDSASNYYSREAIFSELNNFALVGGPYIPPKDKSFWPTDFKNEINCIDLDNDNFCNWGIVEDKPLNCPSSCKPDKDWDDSDSKIGALGIN